MSKGAFGQLLWGAALLLTSLATYADTLVGLGPRALRDREDRCQEGADGPIGQPQSHPAAGLLAREPSGAIAWQ
jgi:hypothetical protein